MSSKLETINSSRSRRLLVQKYGGTSVGTIERIQHVASHIADCVNRGDQIVAVISAMGDQTDDLLAMAHQISKSPPRRELDMLLTAGERISMALVSMALNELGQSAVSLTGSQSGIITDTVHGNARISRIGAHRIQENLATGHVVIVAGFQGVSAEKKEITTLGRGGSDLSAIALAAALSADCCQLFKDVDGVCSADPRLVPSARKISNISWNKMTEMAWAGASILHPRGAHLAAKYKIPVELRNSFHLDRSGTLVEGQDSMEQVTVQAITHKKEMTLLKGLLPKQSETILNDLRRWLWQKGESPQIQSQMESQGGLQFCWSMPTAFVSEAKLLIQNGCGDIRNFSADPCGIITVVGSGFWQSPETLESIQNVIKSPILLDVKNSAIAIAVDVSVVDNTVKTLHDVLVVN